MHVLIDREQMLVLYKHPKLSVLDNVRHIECPQSCAIVPYQDHFGDLTDLELRLLYRNLCGQSFQGYARHHLEATLKMMCEALPESPINEYEALLQAMTIDMEDEDYYRYAPGSTEPSKQNVLFRAPAKQTQAIVIPCPPAPAPLPQSPENKAHMAAYEAQKLARSVPREPRQSNPSTYVPPKGGSKTGRVWEIAEPIYEAAPKPVDWKALRKQIVAACEAEGINSSTASVQYGKWKQTKT